MSPKKALPKMSLLDAGDLPVAEIAHLARREAIRPRAVYQAHKWFARRLAATARSLLVSATSSRGSDFWTRYYQKADCTGLTVADPFMGGGVMLLEASRLGARVIGSDVEPVAAAISSFQLRLGELPDLTADLERLHATVAKEMEPFYRTTGPNGRPETMLHAFFVQTVACGGCGADFDAHPNWRLAWDDPNKRQWLICDSCGEIGEHGLKRRRCGCGKLPGTAEPRLHKGTAICPHCSHRERLIDEPARTGRPPQFRLFAVETIPGGPERRYPMAERTIRKANAHDMAAFDAAAARLKTEIANDHEFWPATPIPAEGRMDDRLVRYGYRSYQEYFQREAATQPWSVGAGHRRDQRIGRRRLAHRFFRSSDDKQHAVQLCRWLAEAVATFLVARLPPHCTPGRTQSLAPP